MISKDIVHAEIVHKIIVAKDNVKYMTYTELWIVKDAIEDELKRRDDWY
jgi:hypothetical protein